MMGLIQHNRISGRVSTEVAGATLAIYYGIWFLLALIIVVPYGLAGVAVSGRKQWGRILCLVGAGFSVLFSLLWGGYLLLSIAAYATVSSRLPDEAHGAIIFQLFLDGLMLLTWIAHAGLGFAVLLNSRYAKEFR
jgi:hypothetical protein